MMEESDAIAALERDYQETLSELSGARAQATEGFRSEYEKLYTALQKSHESEKRLTKKIRDLNSEISQSAQHVQSAVKAAAEDQQQIANLRRDIELQHKEVEQTVEKERKAREIISKLKSEVAALQKRIDQGVGLSVEQQMQLDQLRGQKEQLEKDRDMLKQNTDMLQRIMTGRFEEVQRVEHVRAETEEQIVEIKRLMEEKRTEIENEKRRKEDLEQRMKDLRAESELKQEELAAAQRNTDKEEAKLRELKEDLVKSEKEVETLERKAQQKEDEKRKLDEKLKQEQVKNQKFVQENQQRELTIRARRQEVDELSAEKEKLKKLIEALKKKDKVLDDERKEVESQRDKLKDELKTLQEQADQMKRDSDVDRKKIEDLLRERDILNKSVVKADERTRDQIDLVKRQETLSMNLSKDIARWKQDALDFKNRIADLDLQRKKYEEELKQANLKYAAAKEDLKARGAHLTELKKQIANVQAKRNQQKNLYDAVCMDRNLHAKNLVESTEQIAEMRRKFKMMFHQTTALKEEIREKDSQLVRGHTKHKKVLDLNEKLRDIKEKANRRMKNLMNIVETQRTQMKKLESTILEAEQERQAQQKELEGVIGERDILGAQLIRRNEELGLLYEKIKIQQSTLQKGEIQYNERVAEVTRLRAELRRSKAEVATAKNQVTNVESLKKEIHYLNRTLLREETKARALQEELENPMNVHRWRELEGSDPATYDMIQRVKSLQKLLISKTEEVVEKDAMIQEKEKLYVQLKNIIARQPGPEVAEQLTWYSQNLKQKTSHLKQMAQELEMYQTKVSDLRDEIERHNKDLASSKQYYFQRLRQQQAQLGDEA